MPAFLHGVETIEVTRGSRVIRGVKTAVIGLVGTAPIWQADADDQSINEPVLITSETDAARYFGAVTDGYSIPAALRAIFAQGHGIVIVVNVFDPADHKAAVAAADYTFPASDVIALLDQGVSGVVVKSDDNVTTYVLGDDYTLDAVAGTITRVADGAIAGLATVKVNYDKPDPTAVAAEDVVGAVDGTGARSGIKALADSYSKFGYAPKILIAPAYCTQDSVADELESLAGTLRAIALVDAPIATTVADAIDGRGAGGTINFERSSERVVLCYPHIYITDPDTGDLVLEPLSQYLAGVIAARDESLGYHWSPSNAEIAGVTSLERLLTASVNDSTSEVNQLNEAGIVTVFNSFGSGFRIWGNRSSAYPASTAVSVMVPIRRTADILHESVELAMLQFIDRPIDDPLVDAIRESVNGFIRTLIGRGALIDGACTYDPAKNPVDEIAAGHLTFDIAFMPPAPAERITFESFIDTNLLRTIGAQNA